jgi:hypothetical protein
MNRDHRPNFMLASDLAAAAALAADSGIADAAAVPVETMRRRSSRPSDRLAGMLPISN